MANLRIFLIEETVGTKSLRLRRGGMFKDTSESECGRSMAKGGAVREGEGQMKAHRRT